MARRDLIVTGLEGGSGAGEYGVDLSLGLEIDVPGQELKLRREDPGEDNGLGHEFQILVWRQS